MWKNIGGLIQKSRLDQNGLHELVNPKACRNLAPELPEQCLIQFKNVVFAT